MWSLLVSGFWRRLETLCRFLLCQPCQNMIFTVDSCPERTLMWGQALSQREREGERASERERERRLFTSCLRSLLAVSSSHLSMLTAIWSYYLSGCDRFMWDVLCPDGGIFSLCGLRGGKCVQSQNSRQMERQDACEWVESRGKKALYV